jgi:Peptidase M15
MKLKVVSDTLFKMSPKLASEVSDAEKVLVKKDVEFDIESSEPAASGHTKVKLASTTLGDKKQSIWYVYNPDVRIYDTKVQLTTVSDTLFKLKPTVSNKLSEREKVFVKNGTQYYLHSYLPAEGEHLRIAIANAFLGPENRTTWFVYKPDVRIIGDTITLKVISDTLFKLEPKMSAMLKADQKVLIKNQTQFEIVEHERAPGNHIKMVLAKPSIPGYNQTTWYAYTPDVEVEGNEPQNQPKSEEPNPPKPKPREGALRLPGLKSAVYLSDPVIPGGNFNWAEVTKGGKRIPVNADVVNGAIRVAKAMEEVRDRLGGRPITINSWYRDPNTNKRVGGASRSRHLVGDAVDFVVDGIHPYDVYERLNKWWGSRGGLASATVFTHIDTRGYYARWSYGF